LKIATYAHVEGAAEDGHNFNALACHPIDSNTVGGYEHSGASDVAREIVLRDTLGRRSGLLKAVAPARQCTAGRRVITPTHHRVGCKCSTSTSLYRGRALSFWCVHHLTRVGVEPVSLHPCFLTLEYTGDPTRARCCGMGVLLHWQAVPLACLQREAERKWCVGRGRLQLGCKLDKFRAVLRSLM